MYKRQITRRCVVPTFRRHPFFSDARGGYRAAVLHLRVIVPGDMREDVLAVLRAQVGVAHILVHPGAAVDPPGD